MTRSELQRRARWLARRVRHGWSWAELSARSGQPVWRLRYWQRQGQGPTRKRRGRGGFIAVEVAEPPAASLSSAGVIEITTPAGYRLLVRREVDAERLRQVLSALEPGC